LKIFCNISLKASDIWLLIRSYSFLTALNEDFDQKIGSKIIMTLSYNDAYRESYEESFYIDFTQFEN